MLGTVAGLWRYPVKSLLGERRDWLDFNARGVEGDRLYAISNPDGKFASGKSTRRFRKIDGLFALHAAYEGDVPVVTFPDGQTMRGDHADIHAALSQALGEPLTLVREARIPHMDEGGVHLLTSASLAWLRNSIPGVLADERRFRPNLVIDAPGTTPVEQGWLGKTLAIGKEVVLRVIGPTERCAMVVYPQSDLPYDERILKSIAQQAGLDFGVYAEVVSAGRITRGDAVTAIA